MARKPLEREPTSVQVIVPDQFVSSGDTIIMDDDVTMADGLLDEGYHTNHENKNASELPNLFRLMFTHRPS